MVGEAAEANRGCYGDGTAVRGYVRTPYHALRRAIAARLLAAALADGPPGPVLELGAGPEPIAVPPDRPVLLADLTATVHGAAAVRLDVTAGLAVRSGSVAAVVMAELIEHVYDPRALAGECHRVLRPGGALVLTTPNLAAVQDRWRFLRGRSPRQVDALHPYLRLHIRPFTASSLRALLADAGFVAVTLRSNLVGWQVGGRVLHSRLAARLAPGLGGSLVVAARRPA